MLVSYNWLKKYADLPIGVTPEEVGARLKAATVEVEKVENLGAGLDGIVVGKVLVCGQHPNANRLKVCQVDVGKEKIQVVCGGSNVNAGMLVAVAKLGAKVHWHGEGEPVVMEKAKIRGVESFGMICASTEIGLGKMFPLKEEKAILDISAILRGFKNPLQLAHPSASPQDDKLIGTPLAQALGLNDSILEIDNKSLSHRPDLWGHYGIAREVSALFGVNLKPYRAEKITSGKGFKLMATVKDSQLCPRYMAVAVSGIKVGDSPEWIKQALLAVGIRPSNNVVDVTNYIMMDLGQPMHAFDLDKIKGEIIVRSAGRGQKFFTLDGQDRWLEKDDIVIADDDKILAVAGVMGGKGSQIESKTRTVVFESANFNPVNIRKTANRLGLRTDSAARFEKSLDPNWCELALRKAVTLLLGSCPEAKVVSTVIDRADFLLRTGPIEIDSDIFKNKLGAIITDGDSQNILYRLGFEVKVKKGCWSVKIPTWRATKDISIVEDVIEEVARIYGFENIPPSLPAFSLSPPSTNSLRQLERKVKEIMSLKSGGCEINNYAFVSKSQIEKMGDELDKYIELGNPLSQEKSYLCRNLLPNLLENFKNNVANFDAINIFEIAKVFCMEFGGQRVRANNDKLLPRQDVWLTSLIGDKKDGAPYWQARRSVEAIFSGLNIKWKAVTADKIKPWEHPYRLALISVADRVVGALGEIHPVVSGNFGIDGRIGFAEINLTELSIAMPLAESERRYASVSFFPEAVRDLAMVVNKAVGHAAVKNVIYSADPLIKKVELFDVYEGAGINVGYKSMAYRLTYAHSERTLTAGEVESAQEKIIKLVAKQFHAEVR